MATRWQKRLKPSVRVKQNARQNLIRHFSNLRIAEELRFWIPIEVDALIEIAEAFLLKAPEAYFKDWNVEASNSLSRFAGLAVKQIESLRAMPPVASLALLETILKDRKPLLAMGLQESFFQQLSELANRLAKRPPVKPKRR